MDTVHTLVIENLVGDGNWQTKASFSNAIAFEDILSRLVAAPEDDLFDAVLELSTKYAKDIKMPKFARWMTIFPALEMFVNNWTIIYFISVAIKQSRPSTSSLY